MALHFYLVERIHVFLFFDKCSPLDWAAPPTVKCVTKCVCERFSEVLTWIIKQQCGN